MDDEKNSPFPGPEGDPDEVKVVQDMFDVPLGEQDGGKNVFEQDLFGAPPPSPGPPARKPAPPPALEPEPAPGPEPESPPAGDDSDVRVVSFEDFDELAAPEGLSVEGTAYKTSDQPPPLEEEEEEDGLPELVMSGPPPQADPEPEPAAPEEEEEWAGPVLVSQKPVAPKAPAEESPPESAQETSPEDEPAMEAEPWDEADAQTDESVGTLEVDEDVKLATETDAMVFKAAKAKEGPEAVQQTQELIEHLDGMDGGFLDADEIERTVKNVAELVEEVRGLKARIEAIEEKLK